MSSIAVEKESKLLLHVGCGNADKRNTTRGFLTENWREIRLDIDPSVSPDVVASVVDMAVVTESSIDAIFSSHNIEHLYPHEVMKALREFWRVLKNEGFLILTCPDLQSICALVVDDKLTETAYLSDMGSVSAIDVIFGHRASIANGNHYMAHKTGFTKKVLLSVFVQEGFKQVLVMRRQSPYFDLWLLASKSKRQETELQEIVDIHFPIENRETIFAHI